MPCPFPDSMAEGESAHQHAADDLSSLLSETALSKDPAENERKQAGPGASQGGKSLGTHAQQSSARLMVRS